MDNLKLLLIAAIGILLLYIVVQDFNKQVKKFQNGTTEVLIINTTNRTSLNPRIGYDKIIICDDEGCHMSKRLMRKGR